jgi:hypothetical protein
MLLFYDPVVTISKPTLKSCSPWPNAFAFDCLLNVPLKYWTHRTNTVTYIRDSVR